MLRKHMAKYKDVDIERDKQFGFDFVDHNIEESK